MSLQAAFRHYEQVKKSEYGENVRRVEHANNGRPTGGPLYEEKIKTHTKFRKRMNICAANEERKMVQFFDWSKTVL